MNAKLPPKISVNTELQELLSSESFQSRHIGIDEEQSSMMLKELGFEDLNSFLEALVPQSIRCGEKLNLAESISETSAIKELSAIANKNQRFESLIGQGYYGTETPSVIQRNILENPAWYTAYTPYQPEISQGRLEALINFQTMVSDLSGLDISNASMLDEGTAAAEAMSMARRASKSVSNRFFIDHDCFVQTISVVSTRAKAAGFEVVIGDPLTDLADLDVFGILLQYPGSSGEISDFSEVIEKAHGASAKVIMAADILSLLLLRSPGELGSDIAVGSTQRFGVPMGFGGPHAGYLSATAELKRCMPGRLVGVSIDRDGKPAYRLSLQTREQHIRREKATSNICTAQVLLAVIASMYACYHGPQGLKNIAERVHALTAILASGIERLGFERTNKYFFDTLTVKTGSHTEAIHQRAMEQGINLRTVDGTTVGLSLDETVNPSTVETLWKIFKPQGSINLSVVALSTELRLPTKLCRFDAVLQHSVFSNYQSETEMLRYLRRLSDKDLALDRTMIPLGSCTMKLNATSEMMPITWPEFNRMHPFAPLDQVGGYLEMIKDVQEMLIACTGYDDISLQPNAGSQGEFAGLLAIMGYHKSRSEGYRKICLIPSSAHGTNPASARMCGMEVVVVSCDPNGNVDLDDLRNKAHVHSEKLAAVMITYPSTHGVFEPQITEIADIIHSHGGQVFIDGANLNAMVGLCAPGKFGGDVSHLNLHKTFCIPHGGGGPGIGPVAVKKHLAPFLPSSLLHRAGSENQIASAPFGSASILPITWMYVRMMGPNGLKKATEIANLSANYIAHRLREYYQVLYTGENGLVAHECVLDVRPITALCGITVDDIAKRLIDYGFHAPTMSFPVSGTLMIEPTESESKSELDRFCDALIAIRLEITRVENNEWSRKDNPLVNAPHTAEQVTNDHWPHAYTRRVAAYPTLSSCGKKYWPPVGRIDSVYGDRNLQCSCPNIETYQ